MGFDVLRFKVSEVLRLQRDITRPGRLYNPDAHYNQHNFAVHVVKDKASDRDKAAWITAYTQMVYDSNFSFAGDPLFDKTDILVNTPFGGQALSAWIDRLDIVKYAHGPHLPW